MHSSIVARQMGIVWGIVPVNIDKITASTDELFDLSIDTSISEGLIFSGDVVVITAGVPTRQTGSTNLIKVHVVTEVLSKGIGIEINLLLELLEKLNIFKKMIF